MNKKVVLACTICASRNYTTGKQANSPERLEARKYCRICGGHTWHRETK
ncbi:50S ribosomal protein L33 [Lentibacillus amyloliquefaciens]|nr:50S ribosomal protein L33 [Lentibacillus amyloliquefaciens]